ncbi:MAG: type III-B CRISPR module RAMP protein Cmr1, partial [Firmicutes bacterium]|nr:type III-B CRISPR module RAMP protein Cmr1 [Bacillota bacterium]
MRELKFRMKFLTPAFLGGPDGSSAELRPPSIRGMLRFWWRAINAGNPGFRLNEAEIFGDSSGNGKASSFLIQIKSELLDNNISKDFFPRNDNTLYVIKGHRLNILEYLAYGTYTYQKTQRRNVFDREYIKPGFGFELIFKLLDKAENKGIVKELCSTLSAWFCFGGLGAKSRNGFGSFTVESVDGHPMLVEFIQLNPVDQFKKLLFDIKLPDYTAFSKKARLFKTNNIYNSWDSCLAKLGHIYREARLSLENKHN